MDKDRLQLFQKYVEILELAKDSTRPTLATESIQKKVRELEIEPKDWEELKTTFQNYYARGKNYLDSSNYQDAIEEYEIALSLNPNDDKTLLGLAEAHAGKWVRHKSGIDKRKAIEYSERVLLIKPDSKTAVRIITEIKSTPFQPWIPYKTWWLIGRWAFFLAILGGVYGYYIQNKETIHGYFAKITEKAQLPEGDFDLQKIHFSDGSAELNAPARTQLNKLASFLRKNKNIEGEIACHTDNSGNALMNKQLSEIRAKVIYDYLVQKGVPASQISYRGYGDSHPLVPNTSEANMQKNRRVEFAMRKR
jgi:outer membrane protein OmpA-like peptidoglycan-associated protein